MHSLHSTLFQLHTDTKINDINIKESNVTNERNESSLRTNKTNESLQFQVRYSIKCDINVYIIRRFVIC